MRRGREEGEGRERVRGKRGERGKGKEGDAPPIGVSGSCSGVGEGRKKGNEGNLGGASRHIFPHQAQNTSHLKKPGASTSIEDYAQSVLLFFQGYGA